MAQPRTSAPRGLAGVTLAGLLAIAVALPAGAQDLPRNNLTMDQVRSRFGPPDEERPAVGQPPITRWIYADYSVYFEYDRVLTAVPDSLVPPAALGERPAIARR